MTKDEAVEYYGGNMSALARALGIRPEAVAQWERIPPLRQLQLEILTGLPADADCKPASMQPAA